MNTDSPCYNCAKNFSWNSTTPCVCTVNFTLEQPFEVSSGPAPTYGNTETMNNTWLQLQYRECYLCNKRGKQTNLASWHWPSIRIYFESNTQGLIRHCFVVDYWWELLMIIYKKLSTTSIFLRVFGLDKLDLGCNQEHILVKTKLKRGWNKIFLYKNKKKIFIWQTWAQQIKFCWLCCRWSGRLGLDNNF